MSEVLPMFEHMADADRPAAKAFSEIEVRAPYLSAIGIDTGDEAFLPKPAHLTAISSAYLEEENDVLYVQHKFTMLQMKGDDLSVIAERYLKGYRELVTPGQVSLDEGYAPPSFLNTVKHLFIETAREAELRTLAAYILYSANDGDGHYPRMITPKGVGTVLPVLNRQRILETLKDSKVTGIDLTEDLDDDDRSELDGVLQNDPHVGAKIIKLYASSFLPTIDQAERMVDMALQQIKRD